MAAIIDLICGSKWPIFRAFDALLTPAKMGGHVEVVEMIEVKHEGLNI
jgi:hypothetical protein